jgi:DNA-binding MarR family transcriptional regulator
VAKTDDDGYVVTQQVGHLLRRAYQRHLAIFQDLADDLNLTSTQFVTLCALSDHGPCSQRELVEATAIDQATIRGIIDRLQARGLLQVLRDESDGRKVVMSMTSEGKHLLAAMLPRGPLISEQTMEPLNPAERVALLYLLRKLSD